MPTFCLSSRKHILTAIVLTYRAMLINSWIFVYFPCFFFENGHYKFSHAFYSSRICVNSALPNVWSNGMWSSVFTWLEQGSTQ